MVGDKTVKVGADQAAQYSSSTQLSDFFGEALKPGGTVSKGDVSTVDGVRVIARKGNSDGSQVAFTDSNKPVTVAAPAAADVVDLASSAGS